MSSFTRPLTGTFHPDGRIFVLNESFTFYTKLAPPAMHESIVGENGVWTITVPMGFETDFASVPKAFWSVAPPIGKHSKAAVVHDFLYAFNVGTRKWADEVFIEAMQVNGVRRTRRWLYYYAVRAFGWLPWMRYRKGLLADARGKEKEQAKENTPVDPEESTRADAPERLE